LEAIERQGISFVLTTGFEGKRHGVQTQNGIPGFSLHFPKKPKLAIAKFIGKMQKKSLVL
jgi:hypothetical protein